MVKTVVNNGAEVRSGEPLPSAAADGPQHSEDKCLLWLDILFKVLLLLHFCSRVAPDLTNLL